MVAMDTLLGTCVHFGGGYLEVVTEVFHVLVLYLLYEVGGGHLLRINTEILAAS